MSDSLDIVERQEGGCADSVRGTPRHSLKGRPLGIKCREILTESVSCLPELNQFFSYLNIVMLTARLQLVYHLLCE